MGQFIRPNDVDKEFYNLFLGNATPGSLPNETGTFPFLQLTTHKNTTVDVLVRYAKRSGKYEYEDLNTYYPCLSIMNFTPEKDKQRAIFNKNYFIGNLTATTADKIFFPVPLNFTYQVSAVANQESDFEAICNYMLVNFEEAHNANCFLLNKVTTTEGDLGDVVPYTLSMQDQTREDGRFERDYTYTLKTYLHVKPNITADFIDTIGFSIETPKQILSDLYDSVIENFSINLVS